MALPRNSIPDLTVGDRLRLSREKAGISRREMAKRYGVTPSAVSMWENDRRPVTLAHVQRWAEETHFDAIWIAFGQSTPAYNREGEIRDDRQGQLPFISELSGVSHFPPPPAPMSLRRVRIASTSA